VNLTNRQIHILRHATAWPKCYRNHFVTGEGSKDYEDCEALVTAGLMGKTLAAWVPDEIYLVTNAGMKMLKELDQ
jgi:hypothetical protein